MKSEELKLDIGGVRKILIRATNWIGDAVMTTPALGAVRSAFPAAEIVVVANPPVAELLGAHPWCERLIVYDKKGKHGGIRGLLSFCKILGSERFDLAILFQNAIEAAIIARLARIGIRAGYNTDGRGLLLTHSVKVSEDVRRLHHTKYYLNMLESLGIPAIGTKLLLKCTEEETAWADRMLGAGHWAAINPGAAYGSAKRWRPERFAQVADSLVNDFGCAVLLTGGPGEAAIGEAIAARMGSKPLNLVGKTSVRQMMAILSRMRLVVTNDSGPMHVAAAFDRPIAALFGPTDHTTTSPVCSRYVIVRAEADCAPCLKRKCPKDHRCMNDISVKNVLEAVESLFRAGAGTV